MKPWANSAGALLLWACTGTNTPTDRASADSGSADSGGLSVDRFTVHGLVEDLLGQPVVDVFVTVSTEFCIPDRTDGDGAFGVGEVSEGDKRLITYGETASNGLFASVAFPFSANEAFVFERPIRTPALDETWPLDEFAAEAQRIETEDGLVLTVPAGALELAPFMPNELQVARVPWELAPPITPVGLELVDLFVLHPIQSMFTSPAPVAFPSDLGLSPGTAVQFHSLDYETGLLVPVANGTVDQGGHPVTTEGQGLRELTWIGLSLEQP